MNIELATAFEAVYNEISGRPLSIKTAYKFNKIYRTIEPDLQFYRDQFVSIIRQYGDYDETGALKRTEDGSILVKENSLEKCNKALLELQQLKISDVDVKFALEELEPLNLTMAQMNVLFDFIEE